MRNKTSKIILTVVLTGILVFGASFVKATTNEDIVKTLQSLIQVLTRILNQLFARRGLPPVTTITVPPIPITPTTLITSSTKLNVCTTLSGKYSMTLEEAINLFKNSECKSLGDPKKLPINCYQCDPKKTHGDLYNAVYGEDTFLLDRAAYEIGGCTINIKDKRAYINKGPGFCVGSTDVTYVFAIVCAMRNTPKEGWYYIEGPDDMYMNSTSSQKVLRIELLKPAQCSNCQLICSDKVKTTYSDSCTKSVIASYGGEFSCKGPIEVSPKDPAFIENLIRTALPNITPCIDSDGGQNIYAKGTTKDSTGASGTDVCDNSNSLVEYYCLNNYVEQTRQTCPTGYACQYAACIPGVASHLFIRVQGEIGDKNEIFGETLFGYGIKLPVNQIGGFQVSIFKDGSVLDPTTPGLTVEWSPEGLINHFVKDTLQLNEHYRREVAYYQFAQPGVHTIKCCVTYSNDTYCNDLQIEVIK